jgi:hypothetical protein
MSALESGYSTITSPAFTTPARSGRAALPRRLREVVARAFPDDFQATVLVRDFLAGDGVIDLVDAGRGLHGEPWPLRLLAARMLECRILALDAGDVPAHQAVFARLGVDFDAREGYAARSPAERIAQFRARLAHFAFVHAGIDGVRTTPAALERFLRLSRQPCIIPVARYLFSHDEVLDKVYEATRQSRGVFDHGCSQRARELALGTIPRRDAQLAAALAATHEIFWVADHTSSEINSLIEYPLGTVALVIKPPGSDHEIEIKRAGIRGPRAWDVVYSRNGYVVCSAHHLQGAAVGLMLEQQTHAEARLAAIWRAVHGEEAPISKTLRVNNVFKIPLDGGGFASVVAFLNDAAVYGEGYEHMRAELSRALDNLLRIDGEPPFDGPNEIARTGRFLGSVKPGQAVQVGTSSFRLDRLAQYLRPDGADGYFAELGIPYAREGAFAFADQILSEILVDYIPPSSRIRTYASYLNAAFRIARNRARADRNFLDGARQIGKMFGTCVALCTASRGESFVARNVGLRSVFEGGAWKLRVIFVDHDALRIPDRTDREIFPQELSRLIWDDYAHIAGTRSDPAPLRGTLRLLAGIYRVSPAVCRAGIQAFHDAAGEAFRTAREALPERLTPFFHPRWIERLADFDQAVKTYVRAGRATQRWRDSIPPLLNARRQTTRALVNQYVRGIGGFGRLWRNLSRFHERKGDHEHA